MYFIVDAHLPKFIIKQLIKLGHQGELACHTCLHNSLRCCFARSEDRHGWLFWQPAYALSCGQRSDSKNAEPLSDEWQGMAQLPNTD